MEPQKIAQIEEQNKIEDPSQLKQKIDWSFLNDIESLIAQMN